MNKDKQDAEIIGRKSFVLKIGFTANLTTQ
jgi:hypothetical protein